MTFFSRLFIRKSKIIDRRHMNEDWRVGDLAECIIAEWPQERDGHPRKGDVLRVSGIYDATNERYGVRAYSLCFVGKPQDRGWECTAFRKLRPIHEPAESAFTADLKQRIGRHVYEVGR